VGVDLWVGDLSVPLLMGSPSMLGQDEALAQDLCLDWYALSLEKKKYCRQYPVMEDIDLLGKSTTFPLNMFVEYYFF